MASASSGNGEGSSFFRGQNAQDVEAEDGSGSDLDDPVMAHRRDNALLDDDFLADNTQPE